jgi:hypothetical protein
MSRPHFPSGKWQQIEGLLLSETGLDESQGKKDRAEKLHEVVQEGVKHVD